MSRSLQCNRTSLLTVLRESATTSRSTRRPTYTRDSSTSSGAGDKKQNASNGSAKTGIQAQHSRTRNAERQVENLILGIGETERRIGRLTARLALQVRGTTTEPSQGDLGGHVSRIGGRIRKVAPDPVKLSSSGPEGGKAFRKRLAEQWTQRKQPRFIVHQDPYEEDRGAAQAGNFSGQSLGNRKSDTLEAESDEKGEAQEQPSQPLPVRRLRQKEREPGHKRLIPTKRSTAHIVLSYKIEGARRPQIEFDPSAELKDFKGPPNLPALEAVKKGLSSLETARRARTRDLIGLLGNIDMAQRQLIREDMLPKAFARVVAHHHAWVRRTREQWRLAQKAHQEAQLPQVDPTVKMVLPYHVPGRRMGPPEEPEEWERYEELVRSHAAEYNIVEPPAPQPIHTYPTKPGSGRLRVAEQVRSYSTSARPRPAYKSRPQTTEPGPAYKRISASQKALQEASERPSPEAWKIQKTSLEQKFGDSGWSPRRKLSPDAILHLRTLHSSNPSLYTTPLLASTFKMSPEAIRRILKSKFLTTASAEKMQERRERWAKRHDRIWDVQSQLGLRPKRRKERGVEDADTGGERVEGELEREEVLRKGREENPIYSDYESEAGRR